MFDKKAIEFGTGIVGGILLVDLISRSIDFLSGDKTAFSFATASCSTLCRNKDCVNYRKNCTAGCTACCDSGPGSPPCGGTTGGPVSGSSGTWFKANGSTAKLAAGRCCKGNCGKTNCNKGGSGGNRWQTNVSGWLGKGYEVVVYVTAKNGCSGNHIGLKHGGPEHTAPCDYKVSGECCCWYDSGVKDGEAYLEIEYPHPNNIPKKTFGSIGRQIDNGKPLGVRWGIYKESGGIRIMMWVDTSGSVNKGNWKPIYNILDTGSIMKSSYFSHIAKNQNIEIRMSDFACGDIKMNYGPVARRVN